MHWHKKRAAGFHLAIDQKTLNQHGWQFLWRGRAEKQCVGAPAGASFVSPSQMTVYSDTEWDLCLSLSDKHYKERQLSYCCRFQNTHWIGKPLIPSFFSVSSNCLILLEILPLKFSFITYMFKYQGIYQNMCEDGIIIQTVRSTW